MNSTLRTFSIFIGIAVINVAALGQTVINSKHDFSSGNTGATMWQSKNEPQVCIFCHTPHGGNPAVPLWNKRLSSNTTFSMYSSPTMDASPNSNLDGSYSLLCMSCHDGTSPMNDLVHPSKIGIPTMAGGYTRLGEVYYPGSIFAPFPGANIGEGYNGVTGNKLYNDHPINFVYNASNPGVLEGGLFDPTSRQSGLGGTVSKKMLFNNKVECPSCHNPHDPTNTPFLRKSNNRNELCITCHNK